MRAPWSLPSCIANHHKALEMHSNSLLFKRYLLRKERLNASTGSYLGTWWYWTVDSQRGFCGPSVLHELSLWLPASFYAMTPAFRILCGQHCFNWFSCLSQFPHCRCLERTFCVILLPIPPVSTEEVLCIYLENKNKEWMPFNSMEKWTLRRRSQDWPELETILEVLNRVSHFSRDL